MVDPKRLIQPRLNQRVGAILKSGVDPNSYEVSSDGVRRVIRETDASDAVKQHVLDGLEPILKGESVQCILLGMRIGELTTKTDDEGIITISNNLRNLDKLPFVIANGKRVH